MMKGKRTGLLENKKQFLSSSNEEEISMQYGQEGNEYSRRNKYST